MGKRQMSDPHMTINRYWGGNSSSFVSGTSNSFTSSRVGNSNSISHLGGHSSSSGYFGGDDVSSRRVRSCSESQKNQDELVCSTLADGDYYCCYYFICIILIITNAFLFIQYFFQNYRPTTKPIQTFVT